MCHCAVYVASALDRSPRAGEGSIVAGSQNAVLFLSALTFTLALVFLARIQMADKMCVNFIYVIIIIPGRTHLKTKLQALWGEGCHAGAKTRLFRGRWSGRQGPVGCRTCSSAFFQPGASCGGPSSVLRVGGPALRESAGRSHVVILDADGDSRGPDWVGQ